MNYPPPALDAFNRLRVSQPTSIFDSKLLADKQPLLWDDQETSGSGTSSTFDSNESSVTLAVANLTAGTRVRQTFRRFLYQPGKSQLADMTGVLGAPSAGITRRIGLFDQNDGLFFESGTVDIAVVVRSSTSGSPVDTRVPQSTWNLDKMDGSGASGITLDFSKGQIFVIDFQWLSLGLVRWGFFIGGKIVYVHQTPHANSVTVAYMSVPNLPLRYEIGNDGSGGALSLVHICSSVISEGGVDVGGILRSVSRGDTALQTNNDAELYPIVAIRLKAQYLTASINIEALSTICISKAFIEAQLLLNPTVTGTALSFTGIADSALEADVARDNTTTVSGGTLALSTYGEGQVDVRPSDVRLGSSIAGVSDILVLAARKITGTTESIFGSLSWRETN